VNIQGLGRDHVTFRQLRTYFFDSLRSCASCSEQDKPVLLNPGLAGLISIVENLHTPLIFKKHLLSTINEIIEVSFGSFQKIHIVFS